MIMSKKNIIIFAIVAMMQLPYLIQWEHYILRPHNQNKHIFKDNIAKDNSAHCYLLHKTPFGFFNKTTSIFILTPLNYKTAHPVFSTNTKENYSFLHYSLRAPPSFHF